VHSFATNQPSAYAIDVSDPVRLQPVRGSERVLSGHDFAGLHEYIAAECERASAALAATGDAAAFAEATTLVEQLALGFNVLARYAPTLAAADVVDGKALAHRLLAVYGRTQPTRAPAALAPLERPGERTVEMLRRLRVVAAAAGV